MRLKNILFLSLVLNTSLFSQKFGPYDLSLPHAASAGMASLGVGIHEPNSNLYTNPALLSSNTKRIVDGSLGVSTNQGKESSLKPLTAGFYIPIDEKYGWGITGKQTFYQNFPGGYDTMSMYAFSIFWSYKFSENWNGSVGVGPSVVLRGGYNSSYSLSPTLSLSYKNGNHLLGFSLQSPGKFRLEGYRGVDNLRERLPEFAAIGYSFQKGQTLIYSEARKIFWEKSSFELNDVNSKPNLERGLGAEVKLSLGLEYSFKEIPFQIRTGIETGGFYDEKGVNRRAGGISAGVSWKIFKTKEEDSLRLHFAVLNYSILSRSGGRLPESLFYLSLGYLF